MNRNDIQDAEVHDDPHDDLFVRAAARIGDLTNPFYREERQRDVWNEASAVGFQLLLWLGTAAATAMVWIGGQEALPYGISVFFLLGAASWVVLVYAHKLGVAVETPTRLVVPRLIPFLLLLVAFFSGVLRAVPRDGLSSSFAYGAAGGAALAVLAGLVATTRARRRTTTS